MSRLQSKIQYQNTINTSEPTGTKGASIVDIVNREQNEGYSLIVLNDPNGAGGAGHAAMLMGSRSEGWTYYSKDSGQYGVAGTAAYTLQIYNSLEEFAMDSERNRYTQAYEIKFNYFGVNMGKQEDMLATLNSIAITAIKSDYNVLLANCVDVVSDVIRELGGDPGSKTIKDNKKMLCITPNARVKQIAANNLSTDISYILEDWFYED